MLPFNTDYLYQLLKLTISLNKTKNENLVDFYPIQSKWISGLCVVSNIFVDCPKRITKIKKTFIFL